MSDWAPALDLLLWIGMSALVFSAVYALAPYHQRMIDRRDMQKAWDDWD
jgi:hypothetical protein